MKPEKTHLWLGVPPAKDDQYPKTINIINGGSRISYVDLTLPKNVDLKFAYYNSPKYVCPADLKAEHDKLVRKRNLQRERERTEQQRQKAIEDEKNYLKAKGIFFGLVFSDSLICIKVIESVKEMEEEGRMMHHCVGGYHNKTNSLILSATIDGKRIETIEVSLKTLKVVQSRGVCNSNTEYHDRIIRLVEDNTELIRQRMNAA